MAEAERPWTQVCDASVRSGVPTVVALATVLPVLARAQIGSARYSSIVVDAATGNVLEAANPDAPRHPASLAKLMTLYVVFEALRDRRITTGQLVPISAQRRLDGTLQAGLGPRHAADRGGSNPWPRHQVGQRRGGRTWRIARPVQRTGSPR